jgi:CRISPR-associated endoribonuclease Cas6
MPRICRRRLLKVSGCCRVVKGDREDTVRFRVDVSADTPAIAWPDVYGPARAVVYDLVRSQDAALATELHDTGWAGTTLKPVGVSPPLFPAKSHRKGVWGASGTGSLWFGSPVPRIAACLLAGLAGRTEIKWGATTLSVRGVQIEAAPQICATGAAEFMALSPILVKQEGRFLLPADPGYVERLTHNLRHRADVLGLPNDVRIEVLEAGLRRRDEVQGKLRIGATAKLRIEAAPELLEALYEGGIGLNTVQGFGWLR